MVANIPNNLNIEVLCEVDFISGIKSSVDFRELESSLVVCDGPAEDVPVAGTRHALQDLREDLEGYSGAVVL